MAHDATRGDMEYFSGITEFSVWAGNRHRVITRRHNKGGICELGHFISVNRQRHVVAYPRRRKMQDTVVVVGR
jgi:hypothetical protein